MTSRPSSVERHDARDLDASPALRGSAGSVRRRRIGTAFAVATFVPVALALAFIASLLFDILTDSVSWQVVRPANSGETFAWSDAPLGGDRLVRLELAAQGVNPAEIDATLSDPEAMRLFHARNRLELMAYTDDGPVRWVVTSARDRRVADVGFTTGVTNTSERAAARGEGENLYLNPWLDAGFLAKNASRTPIMAGMRTALVGSLWVVLLVILLAVPVGVGSAIYLEEYATPSPLTWLIEVSIRNLAGIPSIVYGILGLYVFVRVFSLGPSILAAALTLSLLILPVVIIAAREAIRSVPGTLRQASYGLGATRWQTVQRVVLPNAIPGIVTGVILAVARAIGETAPLLLVGAAAFVAYLPDGLLSAYTVVPVQIYSWVGENDPEFAHVASAGIIVLLIVLVTLYAAAFVVRRRFERSW